MSALPSGWRKLTVGEMGLVQGGRQRSPHFLDGDKRPYLRVANVFDAKIDTRDVLEMPFTDAEFDRYRLKVGDILLNEGQSLELVGRAAMYVGEPASCCFQNTLLRFQASRDVDGRFALQLFRHMQRTGVFSAVATKTTSIAHLGATRFSALSVALPPRLEQQKIAAILSAVDDAIETTRSIIDQLQIVKKAMMVELLTRGLPGRHTLFKRTENGEMPGEWPVERLDALAHVQTGVAKNKSVVGSVELPYLRVANVQDGFVDLTEVKTTSIVKEQAGRFRLQYGDVLFTEGGDADKLGRGCVWRAQIDPCLHQNHVFAVRCRERLKPEFLAYWAASSRGKAYFLDCAKQTTNLASINSSQLKSFPVPAPTVDEQERICACLDSVVNRIEVERHLCERMRAVKDALASVLLTGEIRVTTDGVTA